MFHLYIIRVFYSFVVTLSFLYCSYGYDISNPAANSTSNKGILSMEKTCQAFTLKASPASGTTSHLMKDCKLIFPTILLYYIDSQQHFNHDQKRIYSQYLIKYLSQSFLKQLKHPQPSVRSNTRPTSTTENHSTDSTPHNISFPSLQLARGKLPLPSTGVITEDINNPFNKYFCKHP